jgi:hypothetical protein
MKENLPGKSSTSFSWKSILLIKWLNSLTGNLVYLHKWPILWIISSCCGPVTLSKALDCNFRTDLLQVASSVKTTPMNNLVAMTISFPTKSSLLSIRLRRELENSLPGRGRTVILVVAINLTYRCFQCSEICSEI